MAGYAERDFICVVINGNLSWKQNITCLDLQTSMKVNPFKITRQYEKASCRFTACLGFGELSHRENDEIVGNFACLLKIFEFTPI